MFKFLDYSRGYKYFPPGESFHRKWVLVERKNENTNEKGENRCSVSYAFLNCCLIFSYIYIPIYQYLYIYISIYLYIYISIYLYIYIFIYLYLYIYISIYLYIYISISIYLYLYIYIYIYIYIQHLEMSRIYVSGTEKW